MSRTSGFWTALSISPPRFYEHVDMETTRRLAGVLWVMGAVAGLLLLPLAGPNGALGWLVAAVGIAVAAGFVARLFATEVRPGPVEMLVGCYTGALLAIGLESTTDAALHHRLVLLPVVFCGCTQPPRRVLGFLAFVVAALLVSGFTGSPLADDSRGAAADVLLWTMAALLAVAWTASVHAQRRSHSDEQEHALRQARVDPLTGLGNRRAFEEALLREVARAERTDAPLMLMVLDLDDFKRVNDDFGHLAGDRVLRAVAAVLAGNSRRPDAWFRWGGDEFVGVLPDVDEAGALIVRERLSAALAACGRPDGTPLLAHVGVARLDGEMDARGLMATADEAVLAAKRAAKAG